MEQKLLIHLKSELLKKKTNLENELKADTKKSKDDGYKTVYPDYGTSEDEATDEVSAFEKNLNVNKNLEKILEKVNQALDRMEKDSYGKCVICNKEISKDRLLASPEADLCMECQKK